MAPRSLGVFLDASTSVISTKNGDYSQSYSMISHCLISSPLSASTLSSGKSSCLIEISPVFYIYGSTNPYFIIKFMSYCRKFSATIILDLMFGHTFLGQVGGCVVDVHDVEPLNVALAHAKNHSLATATWSLRMEPFKFGRQDTVCVLQDSSRWSAVTCRATRSLCLKLICSWHQPMLSVLDL